MYWKKKVSTYCAAVRKHKPLLLSTWPGVLFLVILFGQQALTLPACSYVLMIHVIRFWTNKKSEIEGGGWAKSWCAVHMAAVLVGCRKALVGTGWAVSLLFSTNSHWDHIFVLVGTLFWQFLVRWSVHQSESPGNWTLANERVWPRSWTTRQLMKKSLAQISR